MNICFLTTNYNTPTRGGIEGVTCRLFDIFRKKGHHVSIVCANNKTKDDELWPNNNVLPDGLSFSQKNISFLESFLSLNKIDILINQSECAVIEKLAVLMKQRQGVRLVSAIHHDPKFYVATIYDELEELKFQGRYFTFLLKLLKFPLTLRLREAHYRRKYTDTYKSSDAVVLLSKGHLSAFEDVTKLNDYNHLYSISNPLPLNEVLEGSTHEKNIVWCGRLVMTHKRPDRIIKIWEKLWEKFPDWNLYILGDGDFRNELIHYCEKRNIQNIYFMGRVDPSSYYMKASILCSTSSSEGFGLVLTEALQYGVIPFACRWNDSVDDIITDGKTGFVVAENDLDAYVNRLSQLMGDNTLRERLYSNINRIRLDQLFGKNMIGQMWQVLFNDLKK